MCGRVVSHTAINFLNNAHEDNDVADQAYDPSVKCMVEYGHHGRLGVSSWVLVSSRGHAAVGEGIVGEGIGRGGCAGREQVGVVRAPRVGDVVAASRGIDGRV